MTARRSTLTVPQIRARSSRGFTLAEIMIVVGILGVLAALAVPLHMRISTRAKLSRFQSDLRVAAQSVEIYAMEKGDWPADGAGGWPEDVMPYLPPPARWNLPTAIGGNWSWTRGGDGTAALRVSGHLGGETMAQELDRLIDDGQLTAGLLRGGADEIVYILQE